MKDIVTRLDEVSARIVAGDFNITEGNASLRQAVSSLAAASEIPFDSLVLVERKATALYNLTRKHHRSPSSDLSVTRYLSCLMLAEISKHRLTPVLGHQAIRCLCRRYAYCVRRLFECKLIVHTFILRCACKIVQSICQTADVKTRCSSVLKSLLAYCLDWLLHQNPEMAK